MKREERDGKRKALVKKWKNAIELTLSQERDGKLFQEFKKRRLRLRGIKSDMEISNAERTNLVYSTLSSLIPNVYAKNPDISVSPSQAVSGERYAAVRKFGKTMEAVLTSQLVKGARLKKRAKACVRSAMTTSVGWSKVIYQRDVREDPLIRNRMNDVQDNIERLKATMKAIEDPDRHAEHDLKRAELEQQLKSLGGELEKVISEGLVIDHVLSEHVLILDRTVRAFDGYSQACAIAQLVFFTEEKYKETFDYEPENATRYPVPSIDKDSGNNSKENGLLCVAEIWSKDDNTVYTYCMGESDFCREPYQPKRVGKHWYPFFPLGFNLVDGQFYPMSDVELLEKLSDEYNETRTQLEDHRVDSRPVRVARAGGSLTPEDLEKIQNRENNEIIVLNGAGNTPLSQDIAEFSAVTFNPAVYDTSQIRGDMNLVSGSTDALQGGVLKAKTATEAEYLQAGLSGRVGERQDAIADWIADMAEYASQILLQELELPQVQRIAGDDAQWPKLTKDDALDQVSIEIRAGTLGKPDKGREQENWAKILPLIQQGMVQILELRQQGMNDMADAAVELLRETLRRFDERIDVDSFIPPADKEDPQAAMMKMQQQLQQAQEAMAQQAEQQKQEMDAERAKMADDRRRMAERAQIDKDRAEVAVRDAELRIREEVLNNTEYVNGEKAKAKQSVEQVQEQLRAAEAEQARVAMEQAIAKAQATKPPEEEGMESEESMKMDALLQATAQLTEQVASLAQLLTSPRRYVRDPKTNRIIESRIEPITQE